MKRKAFLTLENGQVFEGTGFGAAGEVTGEVVFTTGMTGYLETLTDMSYHGQIVIQTFPLIGNYGLIPEDFESARPQVRGYIVKEICGAPSNFRSQGGLENYLAERGVIGLCDIDTRALTKVIREQGVMNGSITATREAADPAAIRAYRIERSVEAVSCEKPIRYEAGGRATPYEQAAGAPDGLTRAPGESGGGQGASGAPGRRFRVTLWDFGAKNGIVRELRARGCDVLQVPCGTTADEILASRPDGVMLTNGPGDPADNVGIIREIARLMEHGRTGGGAAADASERPVPIFGICLGHQLMALARGAVTAKLKYGHRGANQPARDLALGRVYITSQNHGYAVVPASIDPAVAVLRFINGNDGSCEGIDYLDCPAFSVQFHPEASGGPRDTAFLFDRFIDMMSETEVSRDAT
ncbi:MAG: carbamoyl phosphate synthase small subunit [Clostridiales bacterium]|jgi:carbamoyl-phosphate synthase small subunit|nr:carbamoyl phosphate synthase small subunit [Clostridiales bacterium]